MNETTDRLYTIRKDELPPGWGVAAISGLVGKTGVFVDGDWVESKDQDPNGDVRLIQLADIGDGGYKNKSARFLTYKKALELGCTFLEKGDVLVARMPDPLGRACIFPGDQKKAVTAVDVAIVRPGNDEFNSRWLMHFINAPAFRAAVSSMQSGSTRKRISRKNLARIVLPVPPRKQQDQIVDEVEKQFSRLDEAVASLKRAKANLERYKAAVLKAAVEGKLTEQWRKEHLDVEPASKLLERILTERRNKWEEAESAKMEAQGKQPKHDNWKMRYKEPIKPKELVEDSLPETWKLVGVDQLSFVVRGASPRPAGDPKYFGGNIPWITVGDLTKDDDVYLDEVPLFVTEAGKKASRFIERGTFLLTNSGATLGVPKITKIAGCINDGSVALLFLNDTLKKYLYYFFASITNRLRQINQGAAQPNLNTTIIRNLVVPLPPDDEQKAIITEIENRLSNVTSAMRIVDTNLRRSEIFKQSILKQAFSGRLVPQIKGQPPS